MRHLSATRRTVLAAGLAAAAVATVGPPRAHAADELTELRLRWADLLTGGEVDTGHPVVAERLTTLSEEAHATLDAMAVTDSQLWPDLPVSPTQPGNVSESYSRIRSVAVAWATPGTTLYGDTAVSDQLVAGLKLLHDVGYHASLDPSGNWWFWEIGNPMHLGDALVLLYDEVTAEDRTDYCAAIRRFTPNPNYRSTGTWYSETGANRVDKSLYCAIRGILDNRPDEIAMGRDALSDVVGGGERSLFRYVTSGDGFYDDGSFIQHNKLPYVGTYGNVALSGLSEAFALLGGSSWEITDPDRTVILDAPEKSFAPFIWNGLMLETVRGRAVSRKREPGSSNGFSTASSLLLMAATQPEPYRTRYHELALGWLDRSPADYYARASLPQVARALAAEATGIAPAPEPVGHQVFADQDRAVHRRPGWAFTVSLSSNRIGRYEWGNDENNHGWYQGDGMTHLMLASDLTQVEDEFWPTVDPYRMPGTTIDLRERPSGASGAGTGIPGATRPWAGAVTLGGRGVQAMDHLNHDKTLSARKAWFCLDDMVVALGAAISSDVDAAVETVIENRNLHSGARPVTVDGSTVVDALGDSATRHGPSWAHLPDTGGYLLFDTTRLRVDLTERTGTWGAINTGTGDQPVTRPYATLVVDHGHAPTDASYGYAIVPGATADRTAELASDPPFVVERNTATVQSVVARLAPGRLWLAACYDAADTPSLRTSGPCALAVSTVHRTVEVAISDPSRTTDTVEVTLPRHRALTLVAADDTVTVVDLNPLTVRVATGGSRGHQHRITLTARR